MPLIATIKTIMKDGITIEKCAKALGYTVSWTIIKASKIIISVGKGVLEAASGEIQGIIEQERQSKSNAKKDTQTAETSYEYIFSDDQNKDEETKKMENELKQKYTEEKIKQINDDFKKLGFALKSKIVDGNRIILEYIRLT